MLGCARLCCQAAAAGVPRAGKLVKLVELFKPAGALDNARRCFATAARQHRTCPASFFLAQVGHCIIAPHRIATQRDAAKHSEHGVSAYCRADRQTD